MESLDHRRRRGPQRCRDGGVWGLDPAGSVHARRRDTVPPVVRLGLRRRAGPWLVRSCAARRRLLQRGDDLRAVRAQIVAPLCSKVRHFRPQMIQSSATAPGNIGSLAIDAGAVSGCASGCMPNKVTMDEDLEIELGAAAWVERCDVWPIGPGEWC